MLQRLLSSLLSIVVHAAMTTLPVLSHAHANRHYHGEGSIMESPTSCPGAGNGDAKCMSAVKRTPNHGNAMSEAKYAPHPDAKLNNIWHYHEGKSQVPQHSLHTSLEYYDSLFI
jgi:hypothetical protein